MAVTDEPRRVVRLEGDAVVLLDQRRLPEEEVELHCRSAAEVAEAIRTLAIRGAPAIGVAAAYGYALAALRGEDLGVAYDVLVSSRPTAVNLAWALGEMRADPTPERARAIHDAEVERCRRMAAHATSLLRPGSSGVTHCNTGSLATGGYGTALGAIRAAWKRGSSSVSGSTRRGRCSRSAPHGLGAGRTRDPLRGDRGWRRRR